MDQCTIQQRIRAPAAGRDASVTINGRQARRRARRRLPRRGRRQEGAAQTERQRSHRHDDCTEPLKNAPAPPDRSAGEYGGAHAVIAANNRAENALRCQLVGGGGDPGLVFSDWWKDAEPRHGREQVREHEKQRHRRPGGPPAAVFAARLISHAAPPAAQNVSRSPNCMSRGLFRSWLMKPKVAFRGLMSGFHRTV